MALKVEVLAVGQGMCNLVIEDNKDEILNSHPKANPDDPDYDYANDPNYQVGFLGMVDAGSDGGIDIKELGTTNKSIVVNYIRAMMRKRAEKLDNPLNEIIEYYLDFLLISHLDTDHYNLLKYIFNDNYINYPNIKYLVKDAKDFIRKDDVNNKFYDSLSSTVCDVINTEFRVEWEPNSINEYKYAENGEIDDNKLTITDTSNVIFSLQEDLSVTKCIVLNWDIAYDSKNKFSFTMISYGNVLEIEIKLQYLFYYIIKIYKVSENRFYVMFISPDENNYNKCKNTYLKYFNVNVNAEIIKDYLVNIIMNFIKSMEQLLQDRKSMKQFSEMEKKSLSAFIEKSYIILWAIDSYMRFFGENKNLFSIEHEDISNKIYGERPINNKSCVINHLVIGGNKDAYGNNLSVIEDKVNMSQFNCVKNLSRFIYKTLDRRWDKINFGKFHLFVYNYNDYNYSESPFISGLGNSSYNKPRNSMSLVFSISKTDERPLATFCGDITMYSMDWINKSNSDMQDPIVLTAPHHGSIVTAAQKTQEGKYDNTVLLVFLARMHPDKMIISAAYDSKHGHPHKTFIETCQTLFSEKKTYEHFCFYNTNNYANNRAKFDDRAKFAISRTKIPLYTTATCSENKVENKIENKRYVNYEVYYDKMLTRPAFGDNDILYHSKENFPCYDEFNYTITKENSLKEQLDKILAPLPLNDEGSAFQ